MNTILVVSKQILSLGGLGMKQPGILHWTYSYFLKQYFSMDKRSMALAMKVSENTLENALIRNYSAESVVLFEQLMQYCIEQNISIDSILRQYSKLKKE